MKQRSMTSGNIVQLLILFTLPLLIGNIFQQFYSMADTFIVGRTIGVDALAAVGCTGSITFLTVSYTHLDVYKRQGLHHRGSRYCR